jgi:hypothetical protein
MSLKVVLSEEQFYTNVKAKYSPMIQKLPTTRSDSVFVNSIRQFWKEYDNHHNTPEKFKEHCRLLENVRQGYKQNELTEEQESKTMYPRGIAEKVYIGQILEDVCAYIETYFEQRLFDV